jgi:hypothetical protein
MNELSELARRHGTDKFGAHRYTDHYHRYFAALRARPVRVLEIGIGGYDDPAAGGASLRMWKDYFAAGQIFGIDRFDKSALAEDRITPLVVDQSDAVALERLGHEHGPFDIVVDDGSHHCADVITALGTLFGFVVPGGFYCVEDLQTSYWPPFGGSLRERSSAATSVGFIKTLIDALNHEEVLEDGFEPTPFDRLVTGIHLFHNLALIERGDNDEPSNVLINHKVPMALLEGLARFGQPDR